jgi:hypothetical protein
VYFPPPPKSSLVLHTPLTLSSSPLVTGAATPRTAVRHAEPVAVDGCRETSTTPPCSTPSCSRPQRRSSAEPTSTPPLPLPLTVDEHCLEPKPSSHHRPVARVSRHPYLLDLSDPYMTSVHVVKTTSRVCRRQDPDSHATTSAGRSMTASRARRALWMWPVGRFSHGPFGLAAIVGR